MKKLVIDVTPGTMELFISLEKRGFFVDFPNIKKAMDSTTNSNFIIRTGRVKPGTKILSDDGALELMLVQVSANVFTFIDLKSGNRYTDNVYSDDLDLDLYPIYVSVSWILEQLSENFDFARVAIMTGFDPQNKVIEPS